MMLFLMNRHLVFLNWRFPFIHIRFRHLIQKGRPHGL
jgi:hypothetical protein